MKMLMFDFRDSEKAFFEHNELTDFDITFLPEPLNANTVLTEEEIKDTIVLSVFTTSNVTKEVLSRFRNLRIIATRSTAYSHIDLEYCINHNIAVLNVEHYGKTAVAEFATALILSLVRNILPAYYDMKNLSVNHPDYEGRVLNSYTLGIIGCGSIGSAVAKIAHFFGMKVLVYSYMKNPEVNDFCKFVSLDDLLQKSDIITLHAPYNGDNYHMLGKHEFEKMKEGVYIVNTARGELIDIKALYENLLSGKVRGAALDVLECEFLTTLKGDIASNIDSLEDKCKDTFLITDKLFKMKNVIITPHIGYNTKETIDYILTQTFNNIRDNFKGMSTNRIS